MVMDHKPTFFKGRAEILKNIGSCQGKAKEETYNLLCGHSTALSVSTKMGQIVISFLRVSLIQEFR